MSTSILGGRWAVYYADEGAGNGDKQLKWIGPANTSLYYTNTVNELYSALQDLFDNADQMDDGTAMSAQTPTAYTIGQIETNESDAWFIDPISVQHLTGGALSTTGWTRAGANVGIIKIACSSVGFNLVDSDVGDSIDYSAGGGSDGGTILHVDTDNYEVWVRPDSATAVDNFDSTTGTLRAVTSTNTATQNAFSDTGERIWANVFTIGTLSSNTRIYVAQNETVLTNFWDNGDPDSNHIDRLFLIYDEFDIIWNGLIDNGYLTLYARQYSELYDHFVTDVSGGGRTAVPLSTQNDLNNTTGIRQISVTDSSIFNTDETMIQTTGTNTGATGVITAIPDATTVHYYLVEDVTVDFETGQTVQAADSSATTTTSGPSNVPDDATYDGPAALTNAITISYTLNGYTSDVNNDTTNENYSIQIDVNSNPLSTLYEYLKYVTRRGDTTSRNGVEGQQYIGIDFRLDYTSEGAGATLGEQVTGSSSGATGIITKQNTTDNYVMLMQSQGTFQPNENLYGPDGSTIYYNTITSVESIPPGKQSPFGTFAGGRFFGARAVLLTNVPGSDANNYELLDDGGNTITPPASVSFELTGVEIGSEVKIINNDLTTTRDVEIYGEETTTASTVSFTYTYTAPNITYTSNLSSNTYTLTSPISATVIVFDLDFKEVRLNVSLGASDQSIPIQQITERNYSNP